MDRGHLDARGDSIVKVITQSGRMMTEKGVLREHPHTGQAQAFEGGNVCDESGDVSDVTAQEAVRAVVTVDQEIAPLVARYTEKRGR